MNTTTKAFQKGYEAAAAHSRYPNRKIPQNPYKLSQVQEFTDWTNGFEAAKADLVDCDDARDY